MFTLFLIALFLPPAMIPQFQLILNLGMFNTRQGYILLFLINPIALIIMVNYIKSIPRELDESAAVDGCSYTRFVWSILIPLIRPAIATVTVIHAINIWNELILANVYLTNEDLFPITKGLIVFEGVYGSDWPNSDGLAPYPEILRVVRDGKVLKLTATLASRMAFIPQEFHEEDDTNTPQASNWRELPNRAACGTCHYDDGVPDSGNDFAIEEGIHPAGLVFTDDTQCVDCHGPDATIGGGSLQVAVVHQIPTQLASAEFAFNILSVTNTGVGEFPVVQFSVTDPTNGDAPYNIQTAPEFTTCTFGASRLAVSVGWSTTR